MFGILMQLTGATTDFIGILFVIITFQILVIDQSKRKKVKLSLRHIVGGFIFSFILVTMLYVTGIPTFLSITTYGAEVWMDEVNFVPLHWIKRDIGMYVANILLFVPFGFLLPILWKKFDSIWKPTLAGFLFSLTIEISQLFNHRATDIDDLLMNTLGALSGYLIFRLLKKYSPKRCENYSVNRGYDSKRSFLIENEACLYIILVFLSMFFISPYTNRMGLPPP